VAVHTEDTLGSTSIAQVFNPSFAIAAFETVRTEGLIASQNSEVFDFVSAGTAAVGAVIANQGSVPEHEEMCVRVKHGIARVTAKTVNMPSVSRCY
jgi:hypothetical protein